MNPSEFTDILDRLSTRLEKKRTKFISTTAEQKYVRSVVRTWFSEYRPGVAAIVGDDHDSIVRMDDRMQTLMISATEESSRAGVVKSVKSSNKYFKDKLLLPVSRAYWSRAPEKSPAGYDEVVAIRLKALDEQLLATYSQGVIDIEDVDRLSYRGPAAEIREVLTDVLHLLAPNAKVMAEDWYKAARDSGARKEPTPTRVERTKFILRERAAGSGATEFAVSYTEMVEDRLGGVVSATYKRGSVATHNGSERDELLHLLPYINALLRELLPKPVPAKALPVK